MGGFTCIGSVLFVLLTLFLTPANAQDENEQKDIVTLPEVVVEGRFEEEEFVGPLFTETNTKTKITEKGIGALGPTAMMSVPKAINLIPSVHQQSVDPLGLGDISNYHESFRFRGIEPTGGATPPPPSTWKTFRCRQDRGVAPISTTWKTSAAYPFTREACPRKRGSASRISVENRYAGQTAGRRLRVQPETDLGQS